MNPQNEVLPPQSAGHNLGLVRKVLPPPSALPSYPPLPPSLPPFKLILTSRQVSGRGCHSVLLTDRHTLCLSLLISNTIFYLESLTFSLSLSQAGLDTLFLWRMK